MPYFFTRDVKYHRETTAEMYPSLPKANAIVEDLMYRHWNQWEDDMVSARVLRSVRR